MSIKLDWLFKYYISFVALLFSTTTFSQKDIFKKIYNGDVESFRNHISNGYLNEMEPIFRDYYVFFEIILNKQGFVEVNEMYNQQDNVSNKIKNIIERTSRNWKGSFKKINKVIIPILVLSIDNDQKNNTEFYRAFKKLNLSTVPKEMIQKCLFIRPIILSISGPFY